MVANDVSPVASGLTSQQRRRAVVLLIVITLLALFAVVAIGFVYYANSESTASAINRDTATLRKVDMDPEVLLAQIIQQLIYGGGDVMLGPNDFNPWSPTSPHGLYSSIRGHELSRGVYGYNPGLVPNYGYGYAVNDVLTVVGGTFPNPATPTPAVLTVTSASLGQITGVTVTTGGSYVTISGGNNILPTNPVTVTGGSGTGATFNLTFNPSGVVTAAVPNAYVVGDVLTVLGGTGTPAQVTVTSATFGQITSVAVTNSGSYSVLPSNPAAVSGGSGSGAMLSLSFNSFGVLSSAAPTGFFNGANPNTVAFNGLGRIGPQITLFPNSSPFPVKVADVVNMKYWPCDGIIFDPERMWTWAQLRTNPAQIPSAPYIGWNVPYTYPDSNNLFLAAVNANGEVLAPSFWRYWSAFGSMDPSNPNWYDPKPHWKYLTMRPLPSMNPYFPRTLSGGGDVRNLDFGPGMVIPPGSSPRAYYPHDSTWMDLGLPIQTGPDGRKFKACVAMLIVDQDGKINLNTAGNVRAANNAHASYHGLGPWEMNPGWLMSSAQKASDYPNLFVNGGRYGSSNKPGAGQTATNLLSPYSSSPYWWQHALNQSAVLNDNSALPTGKYLLPGEVGNPWSPWFPGVNLRTTGNLPIDPTKTPVQLPVGNVSYRGSNSALLANELTYHPSTFDVFNPVYTAATGVSITSAGSGYKFNDVLTVVGGSFTIPAQLTVYSVNSSGGITGVWISQPGAYTDFPNNPTITGGSGANAAFNFTSNTSTNFAFRDSEIEALSRYGGTGSPSLSSAIFRLWPNAFGDPSGRTRRMSTVRSFDLGGPGAMPWLPMVFTGTLTNDPINPLNSFIITKVSSTAGLAVGQTVFSSQAGFPSGATITSIAGTNVTMSAPYIGTTTAGVPMRADGYSLNTSIAPYPTGPQLPFAIPPMVASAEFQAWRAAASSYLNVTVPPNQPLGEFGVGGLNYNGAMLFNRVNINDKLRPFPPAKGGQITDIVNFNLAVSDRQTLAKEIYNVFLQVTMGLPAGSRIPSRQHAAAKWLAQLAINIVGFREGDNNIIPFNWNVGEWVYSTQMPHLVLNEAYAEVNNDSNDQQIPQNQTASSPNNLNPWVELFNTGNSPVNLMSSATIPYPIYKLAMVPGNPLSDAQLAKPNHRFNNEVTNYALPTVLPPDPNAYSGPQGGNKGFYVVGPTDTFPNSSGLLPGPLSGVEPTSPTAKSPAWTTFTGTLTNDPKNPSNSFIITAPSSTAGLAVGYTLSSSQEGFPTGATIESINNSVPPISVTMSAPYTGTTTAGVSITAPTWPVQIPWRSNPPTQVNFYLRRLAFPGLPEQPLPGGTLTQPYYNPYIVVDAMTNIPVYNGALYDPNGPVNPPFTGTLTNNSNVITSVSSTTGLAIGQVLFSLQAGFPNGATITALVADTSVTMSANFTGTTTKDANLSAAPNCTSRASVGRKQPFAAAQLVPQAPSPPYTNQAQNTFFRHNAVDMGQPNAGTPNQTLTLPFDWLVFPNRQLTSPVELLFVPSCPPYKLTQLFMGVPFTGTLNNDPTDPNNNPNVITGVSSTAGLAVGQTLSSLQTGFPAGATITSIVPGTSVTMSAPYSGTTTTGVNLTASGTSAMFGHMSMPAWFDPQARLYRAMEFLEAGLRATSIDAYGNQIWLNGRVPGKLNINTYWDPEVLLALSDPQPALNTFTHDNVYGLHFKLLKSRTPINGIPGPTDRPFKGLAPGNLLPDSTYFPQGMSIEDTLLRSNNPSGQTTPLLNPADSRLLSINPALSMNPNYVSPDSSYGPTAPFKAPPFVKMEFLNKIFNNVTCRSNVFAVWMTVAFFDVTDGPVTQLAGQVNQGSNQVTVIANQGNLSAIPPTAPCSQWPNVPQGTVLGVPWVIQPGCCVWIENEPMYVTNVSDAGGGQFTLTFLNPLQSQHSQGASVSLKGVLGAEVGASEGRQTRHRMFTVIDRSALSLPDQLNTTTVASQPVPNQTSNPSGQIPPAPPPPIWPPPVRSPLANPIGITPSVLPTQVTGNTPSTYTVYNQTISVTSFDNTCHVTISNFDSGNTGLPQPKVINNDNETVTVQVQGTATGFGTMTFQVNVVDTAVDPITKQSKPNQASQIFNVVIYQIFEVDVSKIQGVSSLNYPAQSGAPPKGPGLNVNYSWMFQPGMQLDIVDPNNPSAQEKFTVLYVNQTRPNTITGLFYNLQGYGVGSNFFLPGQPGAVPGSIMGNPGPQNQFDHRQNSALVPHHSIIE